MPKVYLSGPEIFLPDAREIGVNKKRLCARLGLSVLNPADTSVDDGADPKEIASRIYSTCLSMIREADAVIANITPFRGANADDGTVFEISHALAMGKIVAGYDCQGGELYEKVIANYGGSERADKDGALIERLGLSQNLMLGVPLADAGMLFIADQQKPITDLTLFKDAAGAVAAQLLPKG